MGFFGGGEASTGQSEAVIDALKHQMNLGQQGWTDYLEQVNQLFPSYIQQAMAQLATTGVNVYGQVESAYTAIQNALSSALARGGQAQTYLDQAAGRGQEYLDQGLSGGISSLANVIGAGDTARTASMDLLSGNTDLSNSQILASLANAVNSQAAGGGSLLSGNTTQELYENAALPTLTALLQGYAPMVSQGSNAAGQQANLYQNYGNQSAANQQWYGGQSAANQQQMGNWRQSAGTAEANLFSQFASLLSQLGQQGASTLAAYPVYYASAIKPYNNQGTFAQALASAAGGVDSLNTESERNSSNIFGGLVNTGIAAGLHSLFG